MRFTTIALLIFFGFSTIFAQQIVDQKSYDWAIKELREKTSVPLRLPTYFIVPKHLTAKERKMPLKVGVFAETDSYSLSFCYSGICQGGYSYGEASGERITPQTEKLVFDKTVKLARGITGYYQKSSCGSSCGNAWMFWEQNGYRYAVSLNVYDDIQTLIKVANSAINNESLSAQADGFESVEAFLKATLKSEDKLEFEAKGDLNRDGRADWAGLIKRKKTPPLKEEYLGETDQVFQLYLLLQTSRGGYQIAEKSKETGYFGAVLFFDGLEIKNSSLYMNLHGNFCCGSIGQFRFYKGEWRLVGLQNFNIQPDESFKTDRNLLTGDVIEERQTGERKPVYKRYKKKFPRVLLKDFNLFGWDEIEWSLMKK